MKAHLAALALLMLVVGMVVLSQLRPAAFELVIAALGLSVLYGVCYLVARMWCDE